MEKMLALTPREADLIEAAGAQASVFLITPQVSPMHRLKTTDPVEKQVILEQNPGSTICQPGG
jgi:hypothetical protein